MAAWYVGVADVLIRLRVHKNGGPAMEVGQILVMKVKVVPMDTGVLATAYQPIPAATLPGKFKPLALTLVGVTVGAHGVEMFEA
jgi:hypothetical protein